MVTLRCWIPRARTLAGPQLIYLRGEVRSKMGNSSCGYCLQSLINPTGCCLCVVCLLIAGVHDSGYPVYVSLNARRVGYEDGSLETLVALILLDSHLLSLSL